MKRVHEKKLNRKITKFMANLSKHHSIRLSESSTSQLCLINVGLLNGFSKEEVFEIFRVFGEISYIKMIEGKSFSILTFKDEHCSMDCYKQLNGTYCLRGNTKPLYMSFLDCSNDNTLMPERTITRIWPPGLLLIEDFITVEEEIDLLKLTDFGAHTLHLKNRSVRHYGYEFQYGHNTIDRNPLPEGIPNEMLFIFKKLEKSGLSKPNQLTINHYLPGQGIPLHVDTHSSFEDGIISLSMGSDILMEFQRPDNKLQTSINLPRRSCLIMCGDSRYLWSHGIMPRKSDVIEAIGGGLTLRNRGVRTSLTFRRVRTSECNCGITELCDSSKSLVSEETADSLEREHVYKVYNEIAAHFSDTRHQPWPNVLKFIQSLPSGALLVDIGCGNGKYLKYCQSLYSVGFDRSDKLLELCKNHNHQVIRADCRLCPVRDGVADAAICIAVIHHLATEERRLQSIKDIARTLTKGGRALIYVWAKEQQLGTEKSTYLLQKKNEVSEIHSHLSMRRSNTLPIHHNRTNFQHDDVLVPWKMNMKTSSSNNSLNLASPETYLRFYHVFKKGELEKLCLKITDVSICRSFYDQGNWCVELQRK